MRHILNLHLPRVKDEHLVFGFYAFLILWLVAYAVMMYIFIHDVFTHRSPSYSGVGAFVTAHKFILPKIKKSTKKLLGKK